MSFLRTTDKNARLVKIVGIWPDIEQPQPLNISENEGERDFKFRKRNRHAKICWIQI